mgnify:CR=1 FL=1
MLPKKVVVPGKTLNEVSKILPGDADSDVTISFTEKHIVFEFDKTVVVSRLIEGEYFKIDQMLSSDYETKVKVNKKGVLKLYRSCYSSGKRRRQEAYYCKYHRQRNGT